MEDPCTASFLLTCWDASLLPLRCPEPYLVRHLLPLLSALLPLRCPEPYSLARSLSILI
jgi:hypothetical protein